MACAKSLIDENNFMCSICLDVFTKPVSLPCGHNFCLACITQHWDTKNPKLPNCPLCGKTFPNRPALGVNTFINEMVANFKKSGEKSKVISETDEDGTIFCSMCAGKKVPAQKSCLVCFLSLCQTHLEPHQKIATLKTHKLIEPTDNLERRICKTHNEVLEKFCRNDQVFACQSCARTTHRGHQTVSIEEETELMKVQLDTEKAKMDKWIEVRQQKIHEIQESVESGRNNAEKSMKDCDHVTAVLVDYIKRSLAELSNIISLKQKEEEIEANRFVKELEDEIQQLSMQSGDLKVTLSNDPFTNLENLLALAIPQTQFKDWSTVTVQTGTIEVKDMLSTLSTSITKEMRVICDPDLKILKEFAFDVTFDPDTAHPSLVVSEDRKQVFFSERKKNIPNMPSRFSDALNVLAKDGFLSGRFYYEVQVKGKTQWDLGVAYGSVSREGRLKLSPRNGFWTMWLRSGQFTANAGPAVRIRVRTKPERIGVFVDYEKGLVSFYNVEARALMYTFDQCNFTEEIFPFFCPCAGDGGENTAPLIITPVQNK